MPPDFRSSNVPLFWRRAEQGRPGTFCSEGRGISDNSMKPELPSVLFDQNWLTPCQTVYNIVAHIVNPVSYLNVLMLVSQNSILKFTFNFSFETVIIDWPKKKGRFEMTFFWGRFILMPKFKQMNQRKEHFLTFHACF